MRVGVLCQDALLRDGLQSVIGSLPQVEIVAADGRFRSINALAGIGQIDAVVVPVDELVSADIESIQAMRSHRGPRLIAVIAKASPTYSFDHLFDAVVPRNAGAHGIKSALSSLRLAPPRVAMPAVDPSARLVTSHLTRREQQVAQLIARGLSNRRIAEVLGIREQSVKNLVSLLLKKLECENRVQVALQLARSGPFTNA